MDSSLLKGGRCSLGTTGVDYSVMFESYVSDWDLVILEPSAASTALLRLKSELWEITLCQLEAQLHNLTRFKGTPGREKCWEMEQLCPGCFFGTFLFSPVICWQWFADNCCFSLCIFWVRKMNIKWRLTEQTQFKHCKHTITHSHTQDKSTGQTQMCVYLPWQTVWLGSAAVGRHKREDVYCC